MKTKSGLSFELATVNSEQFTIIDRLLNKL